MANMRSADYMFQLYFNDFKNYIPPLCGKELNASPSYGYSTWYTSIAPYAGVDSPTSFGSDKPMGLACPGSNTGSAAFHYYSYGMLYSTRFTNTAPAAQKVFISNRIDDFANLSSTGLLIDNGFYASSIYYMSLFDALLGINHNVTPIHNGRGISTAFMDGHALFINVHPQDVINQQATATRTDDFGPDVPWVHKTFWGRYRDGTYAPFSTNYPTYSP
jgi:hypothetical protein